MIENIKIRVEGFSKTKYDRKYTKNGRNVPTQDLLLHLKKIIEEENSSNIPSAPPTNMPKRWKLPQLGKIVVKVEELDLATDADNEELMQTSNEMCFRWTKKVAQQVFFMVCNQKSYHAYLSSWRRK